MPQSAIDRLQSKGYKYDPVTGTLTSFNLRDRYMERISRNARRLRGSQNIGNGTLGIPYVGRNDSQEALLTRLGVIPVMAAPVLTSLQGYLQAFPGRRPQASETISVAGPTAAAVFNVGGPAQLVAFAAGGNAQAVTATDSVDAAAKGRALIDVQP